MILFFKNLITLYRQHDISSRAAALSFFSIISFVPFLLLVLILARQIFPHINQDALIQMVLQLNLPIRSSLVEGLLKNLIRSTPSFSWLGLGALLYSSQMLFVNLESDVNRILKTPNHRHYILTRLMSLVCILFSVLFLIIPFLLQIGSKHFHRIGISISGYDDILIHLLFVLFSFLVFVFSMILFPTKRPGVGKTCRIGFVFSLILLAAKTGFVWLSSYQLNRYHLLYGSLASVVFLLLWIFVFYQIFLSSVVLLSHQSGQDFV